PPPGDARPGRAGERGAGADLVASGGHAGRGAGLVRRARLARRTAGARDRAVQRAARQHPAGADATVTGAVFASLHELPGTTRSAWPIAGLLRGFCFVMAVAPAWLYRRTGSLWAPVLVQRATTRSRCGR